MEEVKKVQQYIKIKAVDPAAGKFRLSNRYFFRNLDFAQLFWTLSESGHPIDSGRIGIGSLPASALLDLEVPFSAASFLPGKDYHLTFSCRLKEAESWAGAGYEIASEQFELARGIAPTPAREGGAPINLSRAGDQYLLANDRFSLVFNASSGLLERYQASGQLLFERGPQPNLWRAPTDNEQGAGFSPLATAHSTYWQEIGLDKLEYKISSHNVEQTADEEIRIKIAGALESERISFPCETEYTILGSGAIRVDQYLRRTPHFSGAGRIAFAGGLAGMLTMLVLLVLIWRKLRRRWLALLLSLIPSLLLLAAVMALGFGLDNYFRNRPLPKVGVQLTLPAASQQLRWYGRGPFENYPDRKSAAFMGVYEGSVAEQYVPYIRPQENGNKCDVQWLEISDGQHRGLRIEGTQLNVSVHNYTLDDLTKATHTNELRGAGMVTLCVDHSTSGLGGNSFKYNFEEAYLLKEKAYSYTFWMMPATSEVAD